jgi:hypothetical protein
MLNLPSDAPPAQEKKRSNALHLLQPDLFTPERWPKKPYCSDDKGAHRIRSLSSAIKHKYIQANPPNLRVWLLFDLDYAGGGIAWEGADLPPPTWAAINKENAHAHLSYGLTAPVLVDGIGARDAPMRYMVAVESLMRERLHGDDGFSGLITKNPASPFWRVLRGPRLSYELHELAEYLPDIEKFRPRRRSADEVGVGRNVTLFDRVRKWSYKEVLRYKRQGGLYGWNAWLSATNSRSLVMNGDFKCPLDGREVWHVARSVAKWTWKHFSEESRADLIARTHTPAMQARRGKASGAARLAASEDKRASARLMRATGMTYQAISDELGTPLPTVARWCTS